MNFIQDSQMSLLSLNVQYFFKIRTAIIINNTLFFVVLSTLLFLAKYFPRSIFGISTLLHKMTILLVTIPLLVFTVLLLYFLIKSKVKIKYSRTLIVLSIISIFIIFIFIGHEIVLVLSEKIKFVSIFFEKLENRPFPHFMYFSKSCLRVFGRCLHYFLIIFFTFIIFPFLLLLLPQHINGRGLYSAKLTFVFYELGTIFAATRARVMLFPPGFRFVIDQNGLISIDQNEVNWF